MKNYRYLMLIICLMFITENYFAQTKTIRVNAKINPIPEEGNLFVIGHNQKTFRNPLYQSINYKLVKKGMIVQACDTPGNLMVLSSYESRGPLMDRRFK